MAASNRELLVLAYAGWAVRNGNGNPVALLNSAIDTLINSGGGLDGKVLVHSEEAGGSVQFMIPQGYGPNETAELLQEVVMKIQESPDPNNPNLSATRIKKLNFSFARKNFGQGGGACWGWNV